jgi:hypothetical protein
MPRVETPRLDPVLDHISRLKYLGYWHDPVGRLFFLCDLIGVLDGSKQNLLL